MTLFDIDKIALFPYACSRIMSSRRFPKMRNESLMRLLVTAKYIEEREKGYFTRYLISYLSKESPNSIHTKLRSLLHEGYIMETKGEWKFREIRKYKLSRSGNSCVRSLNYELKKIREDFSASLFELKPI